MCSFVQVVRYAPAVVARGSRHVPSPAKKIFYEKKDDKKIFSSQAVCLFR
jgi:hypothetical protein